MKALLHFAPLFARLGGALAITLLLSLLTLAAGIALFGLSGWFLTATALSTAGVAFNLFGPSAGVRGLSFIRILSRYGERLTGHDATLRVLSDLRRVTFAGLFRLVPFGRRFGRADLVSRLMADLDALDALFLVGLGPITTALLCGAGVTILLLLLLPAAAPIFACGFGVAAILVPLGLISATRRAASQAVQHAARLRGSVLDSIEGFQDLLIFGALDRMEAAAAAEAAHLAHARATLGHYGALAAGAVQAVTAAILVATLIVGLDAVHAHTIDGPLFVGVLLGVIASFESCAMLVRSATRLAGSAAAAERLAAIATATPDIAEPPDPRALPPGGDIAFVSVRFGYDGRATVLDDFDLSVAAGECVAIRGPSGSGKSTIAQLLVRLLDPLSGAIYVGGTDIRTVSPHELRCRVTLMTQDAPVFNDTVRANLRLGRPGASEDEIWELLRAVGLDSVVEGLPGRLDAVLGEGGKTLSAGEARRICLVRTLLSPASIIVLDEPTEGLDAEAEMEFLRDLPGLAEGRTMIVITHADMPAGFDRALELRDGRLAA